MHVCAFGQKTTYCCYAGAGLWLVSCLHTSFVCIVFMYIGFHFDWGTIQWRFAGRGLVNYHLVII